MSYNDLNDFQKGLSNMGCNISGSGCKVCPGMWVAGILLVAMMIQNLFFRPSTPAKQSTAASAIVTPETPAASDQ